MACGLLVLLVVTVVLPACDVDEGSWFGPVPPETSKPHDVTHTAVVADSLIDSVDEMWVASPYVQAAPMKMWTVGYSKVPSASEFVVATAPEADVFIIAHGTNNARDGWDEADTEAYDVYLEALAEVPCLVIVNLGGEAAAGPTYLAGTVSANVEFDRVVADPDPGQVRLLADWATLSDEDPSVFRADGLHHTEAGARAYMDLILGQARQCPGAPAPPPTLAVGPSSGLLDHQEVDVTGDGFAPGEQVLVTQCADEVPAGCSVAPPVNENGAYVTADSSGTLRATLRLPRVLAVSGGAGRSCVDGDCTVVAIRRSDGAERARASIDFEATGTAPLRSAPTLDIATEAARPDGATTTWTGAGYVPWFLAVPFAHPPAPTTIEAAESVGSSPGAYLAICVPGVEARCTRYQSPPDVTPGGGPATGAQSPLIADVESDGTVSTTFDIPRVWAVGGDRWDCATAGCTFVLEQDAPPSEADSVAWAPEWAPWPTADAFVTAAYSGLVGRQPTSAERIAAVAGLTARAPTARAFLLTLAESTQGRRVAELTRLYQSALNRRPDAAGLDYWVGELVRTRGSMSAIAVAFGRSPEFRSQFGPAVADATAVSRAYQRTLGRSPAAGESDYWVGRLRAGLARTHMIHLFSRTPELVARERGRSGATAIILGLLARAPTASEWAAMGPDLAPETSAHPPVASTAVRTDDLLLALLGSEELATVVG